MINEHHVPVGIDEEVAAVLVDVGNQVVEDPLAPDLIVPRLRVGDCSLSSWILLIVRMFSTQSWTDTSSPLTRRSTVGGTMSISRRRSSL